MFIGMEVWWILLFAHFSIVICSMIRFPAALRSPLHFTNAFSSFPSLKSGQSTSKLSKKKIHSLISNSLHPDPASMNVRVRFAPSPTGSLHVGGARTALFNYLFAKKYNGTFIVRIEDTDEDRSTKESELSILNDLKWLGLQWDEGPEVNGPCTPYHQSQRKDIYLKCAEQLIKTGHAYRCFCTEDEIELMKNNSLNEKGHLQHHFTSQWRDATQEEINLKLSAGIPYTIRFKTPNKMIYVDDIVRGHVSWDAQANIGDFIIMRSSGTPVYNFCVAVDDVLMNITHVIRAEEHLSNTLRQLLIIEGLNGKPPIYAHCSLILGSDRSKLSKRHGATSLTEFKKEGYLPSAMVNYLATLGWNDGTNQEIYSIDELSNNFQIHRLVPSSAMFDKQKLQWINKQHLRRMPRDWLIGEIERILTSPLSSSPSSSFSSSPSPSSTTTKKISSTSATSEKEIHEEKIQSEGYFTSINQNKFLTLPSKHSLRLKSLLVDLFLDSSQSLLLSKTLFEEIQTLVDYPLLEMIQHDNKAKKVINENEFKLISKQIISDWKNKRFPILYSENNYHPNESTLPTAASVASAAASSSSSAASVASTAAASSSAAAASSSSFAASSSSSFLSSPNWNNYVLSLANELSLPIKKVYHPLRLALTGRMKGTDLGGQLEILQLLEPVVIQQTNANPLYHLNLINLSERMKILERYLESEER